MSKWPYGYAMQFAARCALWLALTVDAGGVVVSLFADADQQRHG